MRKFFLPLVALLFASSGCFAGVGYLFVTFKGESNPLAEQIYFGLSQDGSTWESLNNSRPVLISSLGEKGVRDPFILRSPDGKKAYLIATDLSIHLNPGWKRATHSGSRSIVVWESTDLVKWSAPRLVPVAPEDAGCTWAPEAIYDEETKDYLVFWASTTRQDHFAKHRIWASRTKDFKTFSPPFIYIDKPNPIIDTTIVRDGSLYYRFTKDEKERAITQEVSDTLGGTWRDVPGFSLARLTGYEGPACFQLRPASAGKPATWCLLLDHYTQSAGYTPYTTSDLAAGSFTAASDFTFPFRFRHGTVIPITAAEYARLKSAYPNAPTR